MHLLACLTLALSMSVTAEAGGSYGSYGSSGGSGLVYGSSGGSSGGGLLAGLRARIAARHAGSSGGSVGASSGGSSGGYTAAYASSGGSSGGSSSGYSRGSSGGGLAGHLRQKIARIKARHHGSSGGYVVKANYSSGGTSYSSGGRSSGGSSGGYYAPSVSYSSAYSGGSSGGSSGGVSYAAPMSYAPAMSHSVPMIESAPIYSAPIQGETIIDGGVPMGETIIDGSIIDSGASYETRKPTLDDDAALLTVAVPVESARVTVNGHETTSDGMVRQFMSRGLKDGYLYTYEVVVTYDVEGEERTDKRTIKLRPGDMERLVFNQTEAASDEEGDEEEDQFSAVETTQPETVVQLHVPADAKVVLAGNETNGFGTVRTFRTTQLAAGENWENYTVRVLLESNGRQLSQERTINVAAGDTVELNFDFDDQAIAMR
ncbi:TIGR03000 domain-containing protein [Rhodopirellula europaea]|uniref:TIGR03000 domain-containing protein n=1 Tax=Rhodopirellula europaea TaxID=1263866 RepID=UPI003D2BC001|tara:strand:+ start:32379 stop:33671 length:1293 start_codon:yes stop_codon:yes gene_type:complete